MDLTIVFSISHHSFRFLLLMNFFHHCNYFWLCQWTGRNLKSLMTSWHNEISSSIENIWLVPPSTQNWHLLHTVCISRVTHLTKWITKRIFEFEMCQDKTMSSTWLWVCSWFFPIFPHKWRWILPKRFNGINVDMLRVSCCFSSGKNLQTKSANDGISSWKHWKEKQFSREENFKSILHKLADKMNLCEINFKLE